MSTRRLFCPVEISADTTLSLDGERAHYVGRVLRLKPGNTVVVFDGRGGEYPATVGLISKNGLELEVGEHDPREAESPLDLHLVQAISRGDRMDITVQKATELGVRHISPVLSERSVVRLDAARAARRLAHWRAIATSACEQCGRNRIPQIDSPVRLPEWLRDTPGESESRVVLQPGSSRSLEGIAPDSGEITILVGPEGGFSEAELELVGSAGFAAASLGPRVLRTETAAIAAIAILQSRLGDL